MRVKFLMALAATLSFPLSLQVPASAATPSTFVIGVDHFDPANQEIGANGQPIDGGKIFEYTDFFTRSVQVHSGDILDFRVAIPDHLIQVTPGGEALSREQFPLFIPDEENALGSGGPKVILGPAVLSGLFGGIQTCGAAAAQPCDPTSQPALTSFPNLPNTDWFVAINAGPGATFNYFCHLHPGMRGTVTVVDSATTVQSQADLNTAADAQFLADKAEGEAAYNNAQVPSFTGGAPGTRTYTVHAGLTTSDRHVAIHDMLPDKLSLVSGDVVRYDIQFNVIHTVSFKATGLVSPFGLDTCKGYFPLNGPPTTFPPCTEFENGPTGNPGPEIIVDPGTRASGLGLNMQQGADSGVLLGGDYGPFYGNFGASSWSVATAQPGAYPYQCTIHDWMTGTLQVSGA